MSDFTSDSEGGLTWVQWFCENNAMFCEVDIAYIGAAGALRAGVVELGVVVWCPIAIAVFGPVKLWPWLVRCNFQRKITVDMMFPSSNRALV